MESLPFDVLGSPKMKSIEISTQGIIGIGRGVYKPWGCTLDLALRHYHTSYEHIFAYEAKRNAHVKHLEFWLPQNVPLIHPHVLLYKRLSNRALGHTKSFTFKKKPILYITSLCPPLAHS